MSEIANAVTIIIGLGAIVIVLLIVFVYSRKLRSKGPAKTSFEFCQTYQAGNLAYNPASTNGSHHQLTHPLHSTGHHVHPHHIHHPLHQTFGSSSPDYGDPESDRTLSLINTPMMDTVDRTMSLMHGSLGVTTINKLASPYSKILIDTSTDKHIVVDHLFFNFHYIWKPWQKTVQFIEVEKDVYLKYGLPINKPIVKKQSKENRSD
ncbi:uncharacterized protein LOC128387144 [Panonychus citri]|uniref:uncharacterized protein LOC128387144 n=1 Tax=Panonychus citri TaxID=50023 RepID=UPI0023078A11|nr:uncharacterized protein LOC128387144 [Panonychus citri]